MDETIETEQHPEKVKRVDCFRTTDGHLFESRSDALSHQTKLDFIEWYRRNQLYGMRGRVDFKNLEDWLKENASRPVFQSYLNLIRNGPVDGLAWQPMDFDFLLEECHHYIGDPEDIRNGDVCYWLGPSQLKQFAKDAVLFYVKHQSKLDPDLANQESLPVFH